MRARPRTRSFIQPKCLRERAGELWHFTNSFRLGRGGLNWEKQIATGGTRSRLVLDALPWKIRSARIRGAAGRGAPAPIPPCCGQDQQKSSTSPVPKGCESCQQKLLTRTVEKIKCLLSPVVSPPSSLGLGFPPWFVKRTGNTRFVVERGRSAGARSPLSADVLRVSRQQQRNLAHNSVSSCCCATAVAGGKLGTAGMGGRSPRAGWWGRRGLATEQHYVHKGWTARCLCCRGVWAAPFSP